MRAIEKAARAMCDAWGYSWDHDPEDDQTVAPDGDEITYCPRPSQAQFTEATRAAVLAFLDGVDVELLQESLWEVDMTAGGASYSDIVTVTLSALRAQGETE